MSVRNAVLSTLVLVGGPLGTIGLRAPVPAAADGGIPYALPSIIPPSPFRILARVAAQFCGRYALRPLDRRMRLDSGDIDIVPRSPGSLLGLMQVYSYDPQGHLTDWLVVLSNFHPLAHGRMAIDVLDQRGQETGDHLLVTPTSSGDLVGQLEMDGQTYAIRWQKVRTSQ